MYALNYEYHCFFHIHHQIVSEAARQPQDTDMLILTPWVDQSLTRGHVTQTSCTPLLSSKRSPNVALPLVIFCII